MNDLKLGDKVRHAYTGEDLWVLKKGHEQILCRTTDLREIWFYPCELQEDAPHVRESRFL